MPRVVLASHNQGKLREMKAVLGSEFDLVSLQQCQVHHVPEESGLSFVENAIIKARYACQQTGLAAIADDSGLEVDALNGEPGIYSARYAGADADDAANNARLLRQLQDVAPPRTARFYCVLVFMRYATDGTPVICEGSWHGEIATSPRGSNGFGYDPLFLLPGSGLSSAELDAEQKNSVSHRGQALAKMRLELAARYSL